MSFSRITTLMTSNQIVSEVNQAQTNLANTEEELSTGLTINEPSDNPAGAALAVQLNGQLSQLSDYSTNITDGQAWTQSGNTALNTIQNSLQEVNEYVTQAANGTYSTSQLNTLGTSINQLISSIKQAADTQYNGQYIFSGTSTGTAPYDSSGNYQGSTAQVSRQIGPSATANVTVNLSSVLGTSSTTGLLSQLTSIANNLTSANPDTASLSGDLTEVQAGVNSISELQGTLGATTDQLTMASSTLSDMQTSVTSDLSNDTEANMASTMTTYSNEEAAFTAALKAGASIVQSSLMDYLSS